MNPPEPSVYESIEETAASGGIEVPVEAGATVPWTLFDNGCLLTLHVAETIVNGANVPEYSLTSASGSFAVRPHNETFDTDPPGDAT